jgi:hypothetical protein
MSYFKSRSAAFDAAKLIGLPQTLNPRPLNQELTSMQYKTYFC